MSGDALGFLNGLAARGVVLTRAGDQLRFDAPKGAMTPELREQIKGHKTALLDILTPPDLPPDLLYLWEERMAICLVHGGATYEDAMKIAWKQVDVVAEERKV